jgi:two-component system OmpR family sensor kinase
MPIRWRLTLWFALILSVILVLSGVVLHILLQKNLISQVDADLRVRSAEVHGTLNPQEVPSPLDYDVIHSRLPPINEFASPGVYIQLIDESGNVVVKSDSLGSQELPVDPSLIRRGVSGSDSVATLAVSGGTNVRIMVSPLYLTDGVLLLEVAQSLNYVDGTMGQVRWALLASTLMALVLATASGGAIVRGALSPVRRISQTARTIESSSDLTQRVKYSGAADEIGELATTFDHMIEHLDRVFQSQRYFVADASHELRGPLTVIRGNLDLLNRNISEADREESLAAIESESVRMSRIIDGLLLLAEVESGHMAEPQQVSLKSLLAEEAARARGMAGARKIVIERQEDLTVTGDTERLRRLVANLLDNAVKYTAGDGVIALSLARDGAFARLDVTDNGIGIPAEDLPHVFDRFYRVDRARSRASGGTGLGLAIVKGIAEQYSGRVTVASQPGKGTSFTVWLKLRAS